MNEISPVAMGDQEVTLAEHFWGAKSDKGAAFKTRNLIKEKIVQKLFI